MGLKAFTDSMKNNPQNGDVMENRKKKIRIALAIFIGILMIIAIIFLILYHNGKKDADDIVRIEVETGGYMLKEWNYVIDFNTNTMLHSVQDSEKNKSFSSKFTEQEKIDFVKSANLYGFFQWKEEYFADIYDGRYVEIYITYTDGSCQEILCSNAYPFTYDKMKEVFVETFGYDIL